MVIEVDAVDENETTGESHSARAEWLADAQPILATEIEVSLPRHPLTRGSSGQELGEVPLLCQYPARAFPYPRVNVGVRCRRRRVDDNGAAGVHNDLKGRSGATVKSEVDRVLAVINSTYHANLALAMRMTASRIESSSSGVSSAPCFASTWSQR